MPVTYRQFYDTITKYGRERADVVYSPKEGDDCLLLKGTCTDGSVGCIWGQAAKELGMPDDVLKLIDDENKDAEKMLDLLENRELLVRDPGMSAYDRNDFQYWANVVQSNQDQGDTWGEAITKATEQSEGIRRLYGDV